MTASCRAKPICGAAKPTPGALRTVSRMCAISFCISLLRISSGAKGRARCRSTASPTWTIGKRIPPSCAVPETSQLSSRPQGKNLGSRKNFLTAQAPLTGDLRSKALRPELQVHRSLPGGGRRRFFFDGRAHQIAPLGPRPVIVLHVVVTQQVLQYEPGEIGRAHV